MEITMPQLGESVTEGTLNRWLVKPGERVSKYQPIAEVITDKVTAEIPAPAAGVIVRLAVEEGTTVKVGGLIAVLQAEGEAAAPAPASSAPASFARASVAPASREPSAVAPTAPVPPRGRFSPAVMRLAQDHGVDLSLISGTGLGGRVTRKDVERYIAERAAQAAAAQATQSGLAQTAPERARKPAWEPAREPAPQPAAVLPASGGDQVVPVDPIRRRIAEKMLESKREVPHAWTMIPVDVTGLVRLREQVKEEFRQREGIPLSYMPFFIKAVVEALKEYPILNSQWAGDEIIIRKEINISIAVATETALAVPVIKNADRLSIAGLNQAVADLAARARAGRLTLDDVSGGTFTVNNTGAFGSFASAPIINYPQAAILSFEAITKTPVVLENDAIAIRSMMNICLSLDHRILDGLVCGRFLQAVKRRLEAYQPGSVSLW